jgi:hypothetical protein
MTQEERIVWLDAVARHPGLTATAFKVAYWLSDLAVSGKPLNLSHFERDGLGHRRNAQRGVNVLEWAGYVAVDRRSEREGRDRKFGVNGYEFTFPRVTRRVPCGAYERSISHSA